MNQDLYVFSTCTTKLILLKIPCMYGHLTDIDLIHKKSFSILLIWHNGLKFVLEEHSCFHEKFTMQHISKRKGALWGLCESHRGPYEIVMSQSPADRLSAAELAAENLVTFFHSARNQKLAKMSWNFDFEFDFFFINHFYRIGLNIIKLCT